MKASLDHEIPAGSTADIAVSRLKARGFTVTAETDSSWAGRKHVDYLYGDMSEGVGVQRRWHVAVFDSGGVVTGIEVNTGLIGP
jgi:hypothetical protein